MRETGFADIVVLDSGERTVRFHDALESCAHGACQYVERMDSETEPAFRARALALAYAQQP